MQHFDVMLAQLRAHNSSSLKKDYLESANTLDKEILVYALNPYQMFNVTSKQVSVKSGMKAIAWPQMKELLDSLCSRQVTGHAALKAISEALEGAPPWQIDLFKNIVDKDLKCGVGSSLVNKVFPGLIPGFDVQLCEKYEDLEKLPFKKTYVSRKLDGVRVLAIKRGKKPFQFYSRKGNEFFALSVLGKALDHYFKGNADIVLDGEVCIVEGEMENFSKTVSEIKRKNHTIENPRYYIFDMLSLADFDAGTTKETFEERYNVFVNIEKLISNNPYFKVLPQEILKDGEQLQTMAADAVKAGWEGLIIRNGDAPYEGRRTKQLLKVKKMHEHEFKIVGVQEGEGHFQGMLGALLIEGEYDKKKITSRVGSGFKQTFEFSDDDEIDYSRPKESGERVQFWKNQKKLIGKQITVQFFEVSKDKTGAFSLRFPVFKAFHGTERMI